MSEGSVEAGMAAGRAEVTAENAAERSEEAEARAEQALTVSESATEIAAGASEVAYATAGALDDLRAEVLSRLDALIPPQAPAGEPEKVTPDRKTEAAEEPAEKKPEEPEKKEKSYGSARWFGGR